MDRDLLADVIEWDIATWCAAPRFWSERTSLDLSSCSALEIGSCNGGLSLWLALRGSRVLCSDLTGVAEVARRKHARYGVSNRIRYASIDATRIEGQERFDVVLFKSVLGGIGAHGRKDRQQQAICQIHSVLKEGGELLFAENLAASPAHRVLRGFFVPWGRRWRYVSLKEMLELLEPFEMVEYATVGFLATFGRSEPARRVLSRVDDVLLNGIAPRHWRYVIVGVARK